MRIPTVEIPQADKLDAVLGVVAAVAEGATTFQEIAKAIGMVDRQGRYYRKAAEILGFIQNTGANQSALTSLGQNYVNVKDGLEKDVILMRVILGTRIFQRVIPFLESHVLRGCTPQQFKEFLDCTTQKTGPSMMPRRASTIIAWLKAIKLVEIHDDRYFLQELPASMPPIEFMDTGEPLLPRCFSLAAYKNDRAMLPGISQEITYVVDQAKRERAVESHAVLTRLVASRVRAAGAIPRCNVFVDLAARVRGVPFIFEMKSTTNTNVRDQIRSGISQLYEYRYLQRAPDATLVLVIENPLGNDLAWMSDYLAHDRDILLVWDGDRENLHCCESHRKKIGFLVA